MKRIFLTLFLLAVWAGDVHAQELTARVLIQKHLEALGPAQLLRDAALCELRGELKLTSLGKTRDYRFRVVVSRDGKRYHEIQNPVGGTLSKTVWNGQEGWVVERGTLTELDGPASSRLRSRPFITPFTDSTYYKGQIIGLKELKDKLVLTVKDPNSELHTYNFDPETYLLSGEIYRDDLGILNMVEYADYQEMAGLQFPLTTAITRFIDTDDGAPGQRELVRTLTQVRLFESTDALPAVFHRDH